MNGYTIISARFASSSELDVELITEESGSVIISERDRPDLWRHMMKWVDGGGYISEFVPPPPQTADPSIHLLIDILAEKRLISDEEKSLLVQEDSSQR